METYPSEVALASVEDVKRYAAALADAIVPGIVIGFSGPLGVGKTEFVRQLLFALGIRGTIASPTFVLESQYVLPESALTKTVYHWDLYRLSGDRIPEDLEDCSRDSKGVTCIEWPEQIPAVLDLLDMHLVLAFDDWPSEGDASRLLRIRFVDARVGAIVRSAFAA